ncbi:MAG: serine protease Do [Cryomorphaceae bacterium]|jgi:serine protease Do
MLQTHTTLSKQILDLKSLTAGVFLTLLGLSIQLVPAAPVIINDAKLVKGLDAKLGGFCEEKKALSSKELAPQFKRKNTALTLPEINKVKLEDIYASTVDSVGIISSVYKCKKCPKWHRSGRATCWILTADGVMVTNYHVFGGKDVAGFGVLTRDGRVAPVVEILAVDEAHDVLIFRVNAEKGSYKPLPLGNAQRVGGNAHIIAHPDSRFFTYTAGQVSRYYASRNKKKSYWMGVTAEYCRGSSGGPVMDDAGNVIGMVSSTNSIYAPTKDPKKNPRGSFQMVIRNCVPVDAIRKMITPPIAKTKSKLKAK